MHGLPAGSIHRDLNTRPRRPQKLAVTPCPVFTQIRAGSISTRPRRQQKLAIVPCPVFASHRTSMASAPLPSPRQSQSLSHSHTRNPHAVANDGLVHIERKDRFELWSGKERGKKMTFRFSHFVSSRWISWWRAEITVVSDGSVTWTVI